VMDLSLSPMLVLAKDVTQKRGRGAASPARGSRF
jgi:hypothetical protein